MRPNSTPFLLPERRMTRMEESWAVRIGMQRIQKKRPPDWGSGAAKWPMMIWEILEEVLADPGTRRKYTLAAVRLRLTEIRVLTEGIGEARKIWAGEPETWGPVRKSRGMGTIRMDELKTGVVAEIWDKTSGEDSRENRLKKETARKRKIRNLEAQLMKLRRPQ